MNVDEDEVPYRSCDELMAVTRERLLEERRANKIPQKVARQATASSI